MKKFEARTTKPEKGNPYYNTKSKGGYSTAIVGSPTDPDCNVLHNCFSGDTKIITREGVMRLDSLVDEEIEVLTVDGTYHTAIGGYYGEQEMYEVTLRNGSKVICTADHRWLVRKISYFKGRKYEKMLFKSTVDLKACDYIPYAKVEDTEFDRDGVIHGFIYGDGSYYNNKRSTQANLCGYKKEYMLEYFEDSKYHSEQKNGTWNFYPYPKEYKTIPDISEPLTYLRGFIAGLIASDGCVDKYGCVTISTVKKNDAYDISNICSVLGYRNRILVERRDTNYKLDSTLYRVSIKKSSIPYQLILNPKQQSRFIEQDKDISYTGIVSVEPLGYSEDCYCVSEPITHTIVLADGVVCGQCVGYAFGRVNEILGDKTMPILEPRNAETWIEIAKKQGHKIYQSPKVGDVMCWAKGSAKNSADGAGHVAMVEKVYSDQMVLTSESGWKAAKPFWTQVRNKSNGNWGQNSTYTFLGFIRPKQFEGLFDDTTNPYVNSKKTIKEGDSGESVKWLQFALKERGYLSSNVDGYFGVFTLGALLAFQKKTGLEVDGICGPKTMEALK